jgi:alpha-tubulin suppressor-like RCC1 family protein
MQRSLVISPKRATRRSISPNKEITYKICYIKEVTDKCYIKTMSSGNHCSRGDLADAVAGEAYGWSRNAPLLEHRIRNIAECSIMVRAIDMIV